jgi:hypothetical protein
MVSLGEKGDGKQLKQVSVAADNEEEQLSVHSPVISITHTRYLRGEMCNLKIPTAMPQLSL